ncbi:HD-GYP domain-containing protein [Paenibacillus flagellatus]|uniref:C-di-GMP phosphodiesterase n=1 Tax=Paenibacillus flagellatus TaxID=2211139 RepID=A0A2V5KVC8_9BACL|nr:HD domain-containing phosphohydrolase [Paenibacillus flagellatus]PYI53476.1 c-di-GMP phosphodiesterase [Paenibacillus flagellatus]
MRLIQISEYDERTMQLAKPVYDSHRRVLLGANHRIHPKILDRLIDMGIRILFIEDAESRGITMEEMMDMPTWLDVVQVVRECFDAASAKKPLAVKPVLAAAGKLIAEMKQRPVLVPIPTTTVPAELKAYAHAVNVALLSLQIGKHLGYNELQLRDLAVGCLLHDIGKAIAADRAKHPEAGFELLRGIRELSLLSAHVAFQHHETLDGEGFPRGLKGDVLEFAQICGLANLYENAVSERSLPPHEALEIVMTKNETAYAGKLVQAFVTGVPSYPPGTKVKLSNGFDAIVVRIEAHMHRPVVRLVSNETELPLADHPSVTVLQVC